MRQHAGPWFVLEHVRPFPGVSLERVVRQIRRGLITETSIVRGPSNDYQWRFAVETPGLCRYFGKCWCCHGAVTLSETYCPHCLHYLTFEKPRSTGIAPSLETPAVQALPSGVKSRTAPQAAFAGSPARALSPTAGPGSARPQTAPVPASELRAPSAGRQPESADLARLSAAVRQTRVSRGDSEWDQPPRVGGVNVSWIAALLIIGTVVGLLLISRARSGGPPPRNSASLPAMQPAPALPAPPAPSTSIPATPQSTSPSATTPAQGISPKTTDPPKAPDAIPPSGNP